MAHLFCMVVCVLHYGLQFIPVFAIIMPATFVRVPKYICSAYIIIKNSDRLITLTEIENGELHD